MNCAGVAILEEKMSIIVSEIFLIVGGLIGGFLLWQLLKGMKAKNWPTAPGKVVDSQITRDVSRDSDGDRSVTYGADIRYTYEVDGYEYSGDRRSFADYSSSNRRRAEKIVARFSPGADVAVYYSPDDPEKCVLEPGISVVSVLFLLLPLIFVVIGVLGLLGVFG